MAEKTLEELYAEMEARDQAEQQKQNQEYTEPKTEQEKRLRDYYENSKIAEIPEKDILSGQFDYQKADRIFAKAMTLIKEEKWQTYKDVTLEDGVIGEYDEIFGFKFYVWVDRVYKTVKTEQHFGIEVPCALKVKFSKYMWFKNIPRSKRKPEKLPGYRTAEAKMKVCDPANAEIRNAIKDAAGTQEFVKVQIRYAEWREALPEWIYIFKDGIVLCFRPDMLETLTGFDTLSEDEAAVRLAFAVNNERTITFEKTR